jgi:hypothetical protein
MLKKVMIGLAIVTGLLIVVGLLSGGDLGLEVRAFPDNTLVVKNIGNQPIKVIDMVVNQRQDCSAVAPIELKEGLLIRQAYDVEERHKFWVNGFNYQRVAPFENRISSVNPPTELNVGDTRRWQALCNIVRVTVTTDKGSETYSFTH